VWEPTVNKTLGLGFGALALAAMTIPTAAADLERRPPPPLVAAPAVVYNWSGFYIGGNIGGKWADQDGTLFLDQVVGFTPLGLVGFGNGGNDSNGAFVGGGQVGYNWQTGAWVFGIEGDFQGTNLKREFVCCGPLAPQIFFVPGDIISVKNNWQASIRGRLGYAWDRFLVYATGGGAFANIKATVALQNFFGPAALVASESDTLTGWTVGAGFEWGLWSNWTIGLEYRFSSFDSSDFNHGNLFLTPITFAPLRSNFSLETNEVTARLNYRFGWGPGY
jgi:outer membrane immunogenic protein